MTSDRLFSHVRAFLDHQGLLRHDVTLVAAVSGGPDSLCLLHLLYRLHAAGGPALHVAHLDHGFRGTQSADEARFVAETARAWNLPVTVEKHDVPHIARRMRQNPQATARTVRYAFLARVAQATQAHAVAVAHQADDQAETLLFHLLRGAGPAGLRGMRPVVPWREWGSTPRDRAPGIAHLPHIPTAHAQFPLLIRPLLDSTRAEIEQYCSEYQLTPRHDPSNLAQRYTRSRIRAELLPYLTSYNPQIVATLHRTAQICADDYAYIQTQLDAVWPELAREHPGILRFDADRWRQLAPSLQRYALRRAAFHLLGTDELSYDQVEAGRAATVQGTGYQQTLGSGLVLRVEHGSFLIIKSMSPDSAGPQEHHLPQLTTDHVPLQVPGNTPISTAWHAETSFTEPPGLPTDDRWRWWVALDADTLDGELTLRRRRPGDRFHPAGGAGSRRLQDFFVDQKVPRALRAAWPVLATPTQIVWVAGLRADARFQATAQTRHILWVRLVRTSDEQPANDQ